MRVKARPGRAVSASLQPGTSTLDLTNGGQGLLVVPNGEIAGLIVALHGAGGRPAATVRLFRDFVEKYGVVVLAPASRSTTWAMLRPGPDVDTTAIDAALARIFRGHPFDPGTIAVGGFSDGASYALTLGLANGDLFSRVVAFSPGFEAAPRRQGRPAFFVTHGVHDRVLSISRTSRRIVPELRQAGYDVTYHEFEGGHAVPRRHTSEAARWMLQHGQ
jgi:phospholipase/carboxylesterase